MNHPSRSSYLSIVVRTMAPLEEGEEDSAVDGVETDDTQCCWVGIVLQSAAVVDDNVAAAAVGGDVWLQHDEPLPFAVADLERHHPSLFASRYGVLATAFPFVVQAVDSAADGLAPLIHSSSCLMDVR